MKWVHHQLMVECYVSGCPVKLNFGHSKLMGFALIFYIPGAVFSEDAKPQIEVAAHLIHPALGRSRPPITCIKPDFSVIELNNHCLVVDHFRLTTRQVVYDCLVTRNNLFLRHNIHPLSQKQINTANWISRTAARVNDVKPYKPLRWGLNRQ